MKRIIASIICILSAGMVAAQADFSGTASVTINANIPDSGGYSSLLNSGNMMGITDITMAPAFTAKLDAGDDTTSFSAWFSLKEYPLGQGLLSAAYGDSAQSTSVAEFLSAAGDTLSSYHLLRLSANVYFSDNFSLVVGRQSMLTGYGYGWNPIDFAAPLKDPENPDAAIEGVDAVVLRSTLGSTLSMNIYALFPRKFMFTGLDYKDIKPGGELTVSLPGVEWKLAGLLDFDNSAAGDSYTPAAGTALNFDLFGIGIYGEASARKGSRNYFNTGTSIQKKTDWLFSGLAGLTYTFTSGGSTVIEYFYNGEGYDKNERAAIENALTINGPSAALLGTYVPGYFSRQYLLTSFEQPFYDINLDANFSILYALDSGALIIMPSLTYSFSGSIEMNAGYTGMFDPENGDFNEISALPVHHTFKVDCTYSF